MSMMQGRHSRPMKDRQIFFQNCSTHLVFSFVLLCCSVSFCFDALVRALKRAPVSTLSTYITWRTITNHISEMRKADPPSFGV